MRLYWLSADLQVPDTLLLESSVTPKAATVSSLLLSWILSNEQLGMKLYQVSEGGGASTCCSCMHLVC